MGRGFVDIHRAWEATACEVGVTHTSAMLGGLHHWGVVGAERQAKDAGYRNAAGGTAARCSRSQHTPGTSFLWALIHSHVMPPIPLSSDTSIQLGVAKAWADEAISEKAVGRTTRTAGWRPRCGTLAARQTHQRAAVARRTRQLSGSAHPAQANQPCPGSSP
jgi:hypothetical protein